MLRSMFVILVVVAAAATAHADARSAEKHFDDGETAYRKGRFLDAAKHFEAAYAELPAAEIAFSAAQAYRLRYQGDRSPSTSAARSSCTSSTSATSARAVPASPTRARTCSP